VKSVKSVKNCIITDINQELHTNYLDKIKNY